MNTIFEVILKIPKLSWVWIIYLILKIVVAIFVLASFYAQNWMQKIQLKENFQYKLNFGGGNRRKKSCEISTKI